MFKVDDKVICIDYEFENLYANKLYTVLTEKVVSFGVQYITLKEEKDKFLHRADSFIIDIKETRKTKLQKLWLK